jgi:DNA recombination protein RmuC
VQALRNHLNGLGAKDYTALDGVRSLDFILMFVPIEAAFNAAFQADERLFIEAFDARIVVVAPTTLLATLRTIENIWRYERQHENTQLIAAQAGRIYAKLRGFIEDFEKVGTQLETAVRTYQGASSKLTEGRGNLVHQVEQFRELGVQVRQAIPTPVLERAGARRAAAGGERVADLPAEAPRTPTLCDDA